MPIIRHFQDKTKDKYYRSEILVELSNGHEVWIEVSSDDPAPSQWWLDYEGFENLDDFHRNTWDSHYERKSTRFIMDTILKALENG
jgi:hypothetical protein